MNKHQCASRCSNNCNKCNGHETNCCPNCGKKGLEVNFETVNSLTKENFKEQLRNEIQLYLCTHKQCKVVYYSNEVGIFINQVKVPIWYKHQKEEYIVCYCRRITLVDIIESVNKLEKDFTKENIVKFLNKDNVIIDCIHNNPTGMCCDRLFDNAIKYALNQKDVNK